MAEPPGRRTAFAAAKVNLSLAVLGRRADGMHDLDSLVAFADIGDELGWIPDGPPGLTLEGPKAAGLAAAPDNLVLRAARGFAETFSVPATGHFTLTKNLPVASGIGGGSADAAAALRLLAAEHGVTHDDPHLLSLAARIGADVPVCLLGCACRMRGIGDAITPVAMARLPAVLVNPGIAVSTAEVFRALGLEPGTAAGHAERADASLAGLATLHNDLAAPAMRIAPVIAEVLSALDAAPGCRLARMSGSGATCFALFETPDEAHEAATRIARANPAWWVAATTLGNAPVR